jgi:hypothetical protein
MPAVPATISAASLQYVRVPVAAKVAGAVVDPTADVVTMAFMAGGTPTTGDLKTASWETDPTTSPPTYSARCLVGPGGAVTLTAGLWSVWVKITDSPEIPLLHAGSLRVI